MPVWIIYLFLQKNLEPLLKNPNTLLFCGGRFTPCIHRVVYLFLKEKGFLRRLEGINGSVTTQFCGNVN